MAVRGSLKRHISKSASDLSAGSRSAEPSPPTPSPSHSHGAPKTHSFLSALKMRWTRSRGKTRKQPKSKKNEEDGRDSRSTDYADYAADNSSEHSSSATQSPQHRQNTTDPTPSVGDLLNQPHCSNAAPLNFPLLMIDEDVRRREAALRQHSFFQLRVHLKRGVELVARDKGGTSDPYVKLKVGGRLLYKSKTIYRDLNPIWDEVFTVPIEDPFIPVHLKVFDYDWGLQDDFMGSVYIDLTKLDLGKPCDLRLELRDPNKTEYLGEILLAVTLFPKTQEDKDQLLERARPKGESGTLKRMKKKLTTLAGRSKDEEDDLPDDSDDKKSTRRRIKRKLIKLKEKLGEELQEESESARDRLKDRIAKLSEKLKKDGGGEGDDDDDDAMFEDDDVSSEQSRLRIRDRIARLGEKLCRDEDRRTVASSDGDSLTSEERLDLEDKDTGGGDKKMLDKLGQRIRERSDQVHRYFQRSARLGDVNRRLKSQIWSSVVTIVLVEGKNFQPMDIDGFSDPYVKFRLGNEKYKSKIANKTVNPRWLEQFDLHLYDDQSQELEVTVWDKDRSKEDFMGRCMIDLSGLERERTHGLWRDLEEGAGSIFLLLTISGTTASETISDLTSHEDNPRERSNITNRYAIRNTLHNLRDVGHLTVKVFRATGLAAADLGGKSDPFCVLELVNARLQTQTEYKTLSPSWQKIFTFNVKDINSVLEVTVYDEDRDHKVEFLGKVAIPLLSVRNGEKKWYCLKDKKLRGRAKGTCPMVLLEMHVVWNPLRAWIRTINPKEEKLMQAEVKFKRQVFVRNVLRLKAIIVTVIEWGKLIQDWFEWERPAQSAVALVLFVTFCHYFEPYMILAFLLAIFIKYYAVLSLTGGWATSEEEDELLDDDDDDDDKDKEEKKSLKERLQAIQEVTQTVQNAIGYIASLGEQIKNVFNFTVPFLTWLAMLLVFLAMIVLYFIPMRYLIMAFGVNKFARKLIRPHTIPNNEVLDLLSRVPDDENLIEYRELRPYSSNDVEKRRERRRHKLGS